MSRIFTILILVGLCASQSSAEFRIWEDRDGTQFEAEFVRDLFDKVTLRTRDGKEIRVGADEFSDLDQKFLRVMVPPSIDVDTKLRRKKKVKTVELVPRIHDTFLVTETVTVEKKSNRQFTSRLRLEIFLIAQEREKSGNYILLGYDQISFLMNQGDNDLFVFTTATVEEDQFFLNAAQQRKGEEYVGYILQITDMQGNRVDTEISIVGKWPKNPELIPNLRELWTRGAASKRSRHFDRNTGLKVKVPRLPYFRLS